MALPDMSPEDRAKALEGAKQARSRRAALLKRVSSGELTVAKVLSMADKDKCYERIKVVRLLKAVPGYGEVRAKKLMDEIGIADSRRLRGLGFRQRENLIEHFKNEANSTHRSAPKKTSAKSKRKTASKKSR